MQSDWFRKQWMFLDIMSSKSIIGKFDDNLFSLNIPQTDIFSSRRVQRISGIEEPVGFGFAGFDPSSDEDIYIGFKTLHQQANSIQTTSSLLDKEQDLSSLRELKINGIKMDILSKNASGPLGWIKDGTLDIYAVIKIPPKVYNEKLTHTATRSTVIPNDSINNEDVRDILVEAQSDPNDPYFTPVAMELGIQFNHINASAPLYSPTLSVVSNALVHPILAYINTHSKHIPLNLSINLPQGSFDGAWTPAQAQFWEALSSSVAVAFSDIVKEKNTPENIKSVFNELLSEMWDYFTSLIPYPVSTPAVK